MRLLIINNGADLYGASRAFLELCAQLVRNGVIVKAVLPEHGPLLDALQDAGVEVCISRPLPLIERKAFHSLNGVLKQLWSVPVSCFLLWRIIKTFKPDLVHSNLSVLFTPALVARFLGVPHIWHIRECYSEFGLIWRYYRRFMLWGGDRIVCVSNAVAKQFEINSHLPENVLTIHDGIPLAPFNNIKPSSVSAACVKYGLMADGLLYVGLVGRIKFKRKGQETFIRAAAKLVSKNSNYRFLIIGGAFPDNENHTEMMKRLIAELGVGEQVLYLGETYDIYPLMSRFDVFVMASGLPEPFGLVTLEAMALSKPVVGTAIGGTAEIVEDGVTGILVPPNDPKSMADAIDKLLSTPDLRKRMGEAGRFRFEEMFEFHHHYDKMTMLYACLVDSMKC